MTPEPTTPPRRPRQCHVPNCLGHSDERTAAVFCSRCQGPRWTLVKPASAPDPLDYVCIRCRAVLAGRPAADPLPTPETLERLARGRQSQPGGFLKRVEPPAISGASGRVRRRSPARGTPGGSPGGATQAAYRALPLPHDPMGPGPDAEPERVRPDHQGRARPRPPRGLAGHSPGGAEAGSVPLPPVRGEQAAGGPPHPAASAGRL
jgi:hypothetical protein